MKSIQSIISTFSLLIIFALFVHQGSAIQCFECNSHNDSRCANDNPPQDLSIECGKHRHGVAYTFCRKITQVIEFSVNGLPPDSRVIRGCGVEDSAIKGKCYQRAGFGGRQEVCACYEDNCNGSTSLKTRHIILGSMNTQNSIDRRQMAGQSNMSVPSSSSLNINNTLISGNDRWQFPNVISQDYHSYWSYGQIIPPMCPAGVSIMPTPSPMAIPMQIYYQQPNGIMSQYDNNKYMQNYNMQNQRQNDMTSLVAMQLGLNCGGSQMESYNMQASTSQDTQMQLLKNSNNITDQPYSQSYNIKATKTFKTSNEEIIALKELDQQKCDEFDRMSEYDTPDVPVISCNQLNPDQLGELTRMAMKGCELAERLAHTHRNRPCFKKIDSLCARMKQDLIRPDGVLANINSQGIAWAVKDFIFVFTRIINAWIIIKGYVYNTPEGLNRVKTALNPEFIESFIKWQDATMIFVDNIIKSFLSLDQLVQNHRTTFQKMDIIINKSNSSSSGKSPKDDIDMTKSPFFKNIEDPYDYFLETYSDNEQHIKKNSNNDTHGNYFSTVVKNSEESQRKALENGTYFKTGVYNPLKRDTNATVFTKIIDNPHLPIVKDIENDNFLQAKNNFALGNNKFGKKDVNNGGKNINNNNAMNNNNNNNAMNNNMNNINNNNNNAMNNFDNNNNLDKENKQNGNLLSDFNISPTHGEGDGTTGPQNTNLTIKCDLFDNENLVSGEQGSKKLFDNGLLSETVLMKYFEPDIIEKIKYLLQKICNLNEAKYFFSVNFTKNYFPDFLKVVPNYIDIRSIILKMQIGGYKNIFEIVHDLRQIVVSVKIYLQKKPQNFLLKSILIFDKELETVLSENIFEKFDFGNIRGNCLNNNTNYNLNNI